jgi:hypothetical protein
MDTYFLMMELTFNFPKRNYNKNNVIPRAVDFI